MLTYTPQTVDRLPRPTEKPWLLLLLCFAWLLPGLIGHDPWKPEETQVADVVLSMLQNGHWSTPTLAGGIYAERPPLFYWLASGLAWLFSPHWLALHDAARLASGLVMGGTLWSVGLAGRELIGRRHGRSAVLILLGSLGLFQWGHHLSSDLMVMAGFSLSSWALAIAPRLPMLGGPLLGLALGMSFLAGSLTESLIILLTALGLFCCRPYRNYRYGIALLASLALAIPLCLAWFMAAQQANPLWTRHWLDFYALGYYGGFKQLNTLHESGYYLELIIWYGWPALPLTAWSLWRHRADWRLPRFILPLILLLTTLVALVFSGKAREIYALPLLAPLALLAAIGLDSLRHGTAALLNWFGVITFGLTTLLIWLGWSALYLGWPAPLASKAQALVPAFHSAPSAWAIILAALMTLAWIWAILRPHTLGRQAITNWAAGITLVWSTLTALWQPAIDTARSYRSIGQAVAGVLPAKSCLAAPGLAEAPKAMLHYFADLTPQENWSDCNWLMLRSSTTPPPEWQIVWQGGRPGETSESFTLLRRKPN